MSSIKNILYTTHYALLIIYMYRYYSSVPCTVCSSTAHQINYYY